MATVSGGVFFKPGFPAVQCGQCEWLTGVAWFDVV